MKTLENFLRNKDANNANSDLFAFAKDLTLKQFLNTCERGNWILWLFKHSTDNKRKLVLASAHCANTVRHLMKDKLSKNAIDIAIKYGNNEATDKKLSNASWATNYVDADADYDADHPSDDEYYAYAAAAAAHAAHVAAYATADYADYATATAADYYASDIDYLDNIYNAAGWAAAYFARKASQKLTADICRKYLPLEIWDQSKL